MKNRYRRLAVIFAVPALVVAGLARPALASPGIVEHRDTQEPLLVKAKRVDLCFQPPDKANQKEAEALYLQFIAEHPGSPLIPHLYNHLGQMFSGKVNPDWEKQFGHVRDNDTAYRYFTASVKHHPPDKISSLLVDAKVCAAALAPTPQERVREYAEYYRWLTSLRREEIADKYWYSDAEKRYYSRGPEGVRKSLVDAFWRNRESAMMVAAANMVGVATDERGDPAKLLAEIVEKFPDEEPGKLAAEKKLDWEALHPPPPEPSNRWWLFVLCGLLVPAGIFAYLSWRAQRRPQRLPADKGEA